MSGFYSMIGTRVTEADVFTASQLETRSSPPALQDRARAYSSSMQALLLPIACLAPKLNTLSCWLLGLHYCFAYSGVGGKAKYRFCDSDKMGKSEGQREQVSTGRGHAFILVGATGEPRGKCVKREGVPWGLCPH